jgi:UDP-N-acetylglucosamine 2-epimerase
VEAGLRSFNRSMPEEINRVMADHLSQLLLCPSETAIGNLRREGITENIHNVGDVMLDVLNWAKERMDGQPSAIEARLGIAKGKYLVVTVHRSENTDDSKKLSDILRALNKVEEPVVFPVHPRARKVIAESGCEVREHVKLIDPLGYMEMVALVSGARVVLTDSGGLQKEAYWLKVPCITMRGETEWVETVQAGWNRLVGSDPAKINDAVSTFSPNGHYPKLYGDGRAASRCVELLG